MPSKINSAINLAILIILALTPIFNSKEVYAFISGNHRYFYAEGFTQTITPFYIKGVKDLGFIIIAAMALLNMKSLPQDKRKITLLSAMPIVVFIAVSFMLSVGKDPIFALAGLRWAFPFFLAAILIGNIDDILMRRIAKIIAVIFIFSVALQIYEQLLMREFVQAYKYMQPWPQWRIAFFQLANKNMLGLMRPGGIFIMANTAGFFSCVAGFFMYFYLNKSPFRTLSLWLVPISIILTGSAMAAIVFFISVYVLLNKKILNTIRSKYLFLTLFLLMIITLPILTGRDDFFNSPKIRLELFLKQSGQAELISTKFGLGTNTMALILEKSYREHSLSSSPILDSMITGILVNTGLIGLFGFGIAYSYWLTKALKSGQQNVIVFALIYSFFAITISVTEAFPMNLLLAVGLAYFTPQIFKGSKWIQKKISL